MKEELKDIAKRIYNDIQSTINEYGVEGCPDFLNFCFDENNDFVEYFFTSDIFGGNDSYKWGGIERNEYVNMSVEDIEEELNYTLNN